MAAAGAHNCLMTGSPGAGKTLMPRSLPSILPKLSLDEALDITRIYSVTGQLPTDTPLVNQRPFRSPHHTISNAGLVSGGRLPRPGEISLAHRGVLFLDELPEFGPKNLETLRQPLEDKVVTISRAQGSLSFPANFMLVGAMNPCGRVLACRYAAGAFVPQVEHIWSKQSVIVTNWGHEWPPWFAAARGWRGRRRGWPLAGG